MKISARNQSPGRIAAVTPSAANGRVDIGGEVTAPINASDVLIGK